MTTSFVVIDELKRLESECLKLAAALTALFDARSTTQTQMEDASVKLRAYMDAIESMKHTIRSNENGSEEIEHWKQRRSQLKADYDKLAAQFETREKIDSKTSGSELTDEERRVMSGRAPPPVVQNRLLELATAPKTPIPEQRTFEPAPLKQPTKHQKKASRVPVQILNDTPEPDGRSHPQPAKTTNPSASSTTTVTPTTATGAATTTITVATSSNSKKVAPSSSVNNNGSNGHHHQPSDQQPASGCCVIL